MSIYILPYSRSWTKPNMNSSVKTFRNKLFWMKNLEIRNLIDVKWKIALIFLFILSELHCFTWKFTERFLALTFCKRLLCPWRQDLSGKTRKFSASFKGALDSIINFKSLKRKLRIFQALEFDAKGNHEDKCYEASLKDFHSCFLWCLQNWETWLFILHQTLCLLTLMYIIFVARLWLLCSSWYIAPLHLPLKETLLHF